MTPKRRTLKNRSLAVNVKSKRGDCLKIYRENLKKAKLQESNIVSTNTKSNEPSHDANSSTSSVPTTSTTQSIENICTPILSRDFNDPGIATNQNSKIARVRKIIQEHMHSYSKENVENTETEDVNKITASSTVHNTLNNTSSDHMYAAASHKDDEEKLCVEIEKENLTAFEAKFQGCRIVDITFYEEQLAGLMNDHGSPTKCNFSHMKLLNEKRHGVAFIRTYECKMCNRKINLYSHRYLKIPKDYEEHKEMNPNEAAVVATMLAGVGQIVLDRILATLNVPGISSATYAKYRSSAAENLHQVALEDMRRAAQKAAELAIAKGDVTKDGIPLITVIIDGAWCRRSYRNTYNSLGGCGVIIAADTGEVIFIAVKNKFCVICAKAHKEKKEPKKHDCFKNWPADKSSASMEAHAIVEGFVSSLSMYGIIYHKVVADGDSSVYKCILDADPYEGHVTVQKIECKNHLMRNFCTNLQAECLTTSQGKRDVVALKKYVSGKIMQLRSGIIKAIEYRSKEGVTRKAALELATDIINAPSHVFGEHLKCAQLKYFCDGTLKEGESNKVPELQKIGLYNTIMERCNILANHALSLLHNITTNAVESFNAIIASKISGKRINFTGRDSYHARIYASVSHHQDGEAFRKVHRKAVGVSPAHFAKLQEQKVQRRRIRQRGRCKKRLYQDPSNNSQTDYGPNVTQPDMSMENYELAKLRKISDLKALYSNRTKIELETREQRDSLVWKPYRKNLVTASNTGRICRMLNTTSTAAIIKAMLYSEFDSDAVTWGREQEVKAVTAVENTINDYVQNCGLFIHPQHFFIGASPDGLIGDDGIVEVKCPYAARKMSIRRAVDCGIIKCLDDNLELKATHMYYYQIQCQLEVTNRDFCLFAIWTLRETLILSIKRDQKFWQENMFGRIEQFYYNCLLPELVDSRNKRSLELRNINIEGKTVDKSTKQQEKKDQKNVKAKKPKKSPRKRDPQPMLLIKNIEPENLTPESTPPKVLKKKKSETKKVDSVACSSRSVKPTKRRIRKHPKANDIPILAKPLSDLTPPQKKLKASEDENPNDFAELLLNSQSLPSTSRNIQV